MTGSLAVENVLSLKTSNELMDILILPLLQTAVFSIGGYSTKQIPILSTDTRKLDFVNHVYQSTFTSFRRFGSKVSELLLDGLLTTETS